MDQETEANNKPGKRLKKIKIVGDFSTEYSV